MLSNGNSFAANGNSACASQDRGVWSLPWLFRVLVPGYQGGWPA